jgi:hypothetical protein
MCPVATRQFRVSGLSERAEWPSSKCTGSTSLPRVEHFALNGSKRGRRAPRCREVKVQILSEVRNSEMWLQKRQTGVYSPCGKSKCKSRLK